MKTISITVSIIDEELNPIVEVTANRYTGSDFGNDVYQAIMHDKVMLDRFWEMMSSGIHKYLKESFVNMNIQSSFILGHHDEQAVDQT